MTTERWPGHQPDLTLYQEAVARGIPTDNHESDLYLKVTPASRALLARRGIMARMFPDRGTGELWFDVPFMFDPWWSAHTGAGRKES